MNTTTHCKLDYSAAFDAAACRSLMEAVLASCGANPKILCHKRMGEPQITYRQVAKTLALEAGFDVRCIAAVADCAGTTVTYAKQAVERRLARDGERAPLAPVLERARGAAKKWREEAWKVAAAAAQAA